MNKTEYFCDIMSAYLKGKQSNTKTKMENGLIVMTRIGILVKTIELKGNRAF